MTKRTLKEALAAASLDLDALASRTDGKFRAEATEGNHANAELEGFCAAYQARPDNQSLGAFLKALGTAVERDNLCDGCLQAAFGLIAETKARQLIAEAFGIPVKNVHAI